MAYAAGATITNRDKHEFTDSIPIMLTNGTGHFFLGGVGQGPRDGCKNPGVVRVIDR